MDFRKEDLNPSEIPQTPEQQIAFLKEENQKLREENEILKELSTKDPVTGLLNRRGLDESLEKNISGKLREIWNKEEGERSIRVMYFDLDDLKETNTNYGHAGGDQLIMKMSQYIKEIARRPEDIAARVGGDEFLLFLENDDRTKDWYINKLQNYPNLNFSAGIVDINLNEIYLQVQNKLLQTNQYTYDNTRSEVMKEIQKTKKVADAVLYEIKEHKGKLPPEQSIPKESNFLFLNELNEEQKTKVSQKVQNTYN